MGLRGKKRNPIYVHNPDNRAGVLPEFNVRTTTTYAGDIVERRTFKVSAPSADDAIEFVVRILEDEGRDLNTRITSAKLSGRLYFTGGADIVADGGYITKGDMQ